jgi:hypothetical protein
VVHRWALPFSQALPRPRRDQPPFRDDKVHWFRAYLYGNGDLLAVYHADGDTPYGYGLAKLDKDSNLLWAYDGYAHHDVDVGDDGRVYTLTQRLVSRPPDGLDFLPEQYIADDLVVLSPEGRELDRVPLLEAFRDSPHALTLELLRRPNQDAPPPGLPAPPGGTDKGDVLHANSVKVLPRSLAAKFPLFKPGQVLISLRTLDVLAVLDVPSRAVVWAAHGVWRHQHDADFLDNGRLLLFDNLGSPAGSRVLEYDPIRQAVPWSYAPGETTAFTANFRGASQRLGNGNTLIVDPDQCRILEVTRDKERVWQYVVPLSGKGRDAGLAAAVTGARRYAPDELTFLRGDTRARP